MLTKGILAGILAIGLLVTASMPASAAHFKMRDYTNSSVEAQIENMRLYGNVLALVSDHVSHSALWNAGTPLNGTDKNRLWHLMSNSSKTSKYGAAYKAQLVTHARDTTNTTPTLASMTVYGTAGTALTFSETGGHTPDEAFDRFFGTLANASGDIFVGQGLIQNNTTYSLRGKHTDTGTYGSGPRGSLLVAHMFDLANSAVRVAANLFKDAGNFFNNNGALENY